MMVVPSVVYDDPHMMVWPLGSVIEEPHMMVWLFVQSATCPYSRDLAAIDASGLPRPSKLRSPVLSSVESSHASGACSSERIRMPTPAYSRDARVPVSQKIAPLGELSTPPMSPEGSSPRRLDATLRDAMKFTLPAPAPIRPASGM